MYSLSAVEFWCYIAILSIIFELTCALLLMLGESGGGLDDERSFVVAFPFAVLVVVTLRAKLGAAVWYHTLISQIPFGIHT